MPDPDWATTGLPLPNHDLGVNTDAGAIRTDMTGFPRQQADLATSARTYSVNWTFTLAEFQTFQTFFATTLKNGVLYFNMKIEDGAGVVNTLVRFVIAQRKGYTHTYVPFQQYKVSATLERFLVQDVEPDLAPIVPLWYQPEIHVTGTYHLTLADAGKKFRCTPVSGSQILLDQLNPADDLTGMTIGVQLDAPGSVLLSSVPTNSPPLPKTDVRSTFTNTAVVGDASTVDPNGDTITYSMGTTAAGHGVVSGINSATGAYTYTPATGYNGVDQFTIQASDGIGGVTQVLCVMNIVSPVETWLDVAKRLGAYGAYRADTGVTLSGGQVLTVADQTGNGNTLQDVYTLSLNKRATVVTGTGSGKKWFRNTYGGSAANSRYLWLTPVSGSFPTRAKVVCVARMQNVTTAGNGYMPVVMIWTSGAITGSGPGNDTFTLGYNSGALGWSVQSYGQGASAAKAWAPVVDTTFVAEVCQQRTSTTLQADSSYIRGQSLNFGSTGTPAAMNVLSFGSREDKGAISATGSAEVDIAAFVIFPTTLDTTDIAIRADIEKMKNLMQIEFA